MRYYIDVRKCRVGYVVQFGCYFPGTNQIGWAEYPTRWRATFAGAVRYGLRRFRRRVTPIERLVIT